MHTPQEIIQIAKISQYLAGNSIESRGLYGGNVPSNLERKLYVERKSVEWKYTYDPSNTSDLVATSNYLYALCAPYNLLAEAIITGGGSGTVIVPGGGGILSTLMLEISGDQFANINEYSDPRLVGKELKIFSNGIPRFLYNPNPPTGFVQEWIATTTGFQIVLDGFDSSTIDYHLFVFVAGTIPSSSSSGSAKNETISFSGLDTYVLPWTTRSLLYGEFGVFQVLQDYGSGFQATGIAPTPDAGSNPTIYTFTGLGNYPTKIITT